jgi:hypothetical protein
MRSQSNRTTRYQLQSMKYMTEEFINAELTTIWKQFEGKFQSKHLNDVLERQFVFPIPEQSDILISGINPSYQPNIVNALLRYTYNDAKHSYFTGLRKITPTEINGATATVSYIDLFYFRNTEQAILKDYYAEKQIGIDFLAKQLKVTQEIVEWIAPKVILVMNKGSWAFWGKDLRYTWMGYEMRLLNDSLQFGELYEIIGLRDNGGRIAPEISQSNLMRTKVYFSRHLNRISNANLALIQAEVSSLF